MTLHDELYMLQLQYMLNVKKKYVLFCSVLFCSKSLKSVFAQMMLKAFAYPILTVLTQYEPNLTNQFVPISVY